MIGLLRALRRGVEALYDDPNGAAAVVLDQMSLNPEHARRACREFVSKKIIPRDLSISPQVFAATLGAMGRSEPTNGEPQSEMQLCMDMRFLSRAGVGRALVNRDSEGSPYGRDKPIAGI
jgi:hypothetical protein